MIRKAIIPAAGLGTRMLPQTKASPKEMIPIFDKPTLQYIVEEAYESGITDILIITGRNKNSIEDHFDRNIELEKSIICKAVSNKALGIIGDYNLESQIRAKIFREILLELFSNVEVN